MRKSIGLGVPNAPRAFGLYLLSRRSPTTISKLVYELRRRGCILFDPVHRTKSSFLVMAPLAKLRSRCGSRTTISRRGACTQILVGVPVQYLECSSACFFSSERIIARDPQDILCTFYFETNARRDILMNPAPARASTATNKRSV